MMICVQGTWYADMEHNDTADEPLSAQDIAMLMKMGSWRVSRLVIPQIELIVSQIECYWREILPDLRVVAVKEGEEVCCTVLQKSMNGAFLIPLNSFCCRT